MDHKEFPVPEEELNLEDILREFSDQPEMEPDTMLPPLGDTQRLDCLAGAIPASPVTQGETVRFEPVEEAQEETPAPQPPQPEASRIEPFSEDWEPEYEEPMGTYIPQEPIPFQPKDRMRQLREKLVSGPEHRYYELAEAGTATLRLSGFILFLLFLTSAGLTLALDWGWISPLRIRTVAFSQLLCLLVAVLLCHGRVLEGISSLFRGQFTLHTMLSLSFAACLADSLLCLSQQRISCCCIFCLQAACAQWAVCFARRTEMEQMDTLRKASELTAIVKIEHYYDQIPGYVTTQGEPEAFTENYRATPGPERALRLYCIGALSFSLLLSLIIGLIHGWDTALQVLCAALLAAMPATAFISMRRPERILEKRLHSVGTVLCGWQGVRAVEKPAAVPLTHRDLFPRDAIGMNGMKFYGKVDADMVLCYTGSLVCHQNGSLSEIFAPLMAGRYIRHAPVEEFSSYPGGLSALVDGEPVAVGTLEFMRQLSVEVPKEARIAGAVYTAVDGALSGVFVLRVSRSKAAANGLRNLCGCRDLIPVLISRDFLLTGRFLKERLRVNPESLQFPEAEECASLQAQFPPEDAPVVALTVRKGLPQRAYAITGACALRTAQRGGALIHIIGGCLGMGAVAILAILGALHLLTPVNLLLYSLIWMIPGWLITEWTRYL